jgi:hypothetical protein
MNKWSEMDEAYLLMWKALKVVTTNKAIREWLTATDPKALEQADAAVLAGTAAVNKGA